MPSTFAALRHPGFRSLWTAMVATQVGWQLWVFGVGWFAVELAVRDARPELAPLFVGLFGAAQAVPALALGLVGGVVADRVDRRRLLALAYGVAGVTSIALAILAAGGGAGWSVLAAAMAFVLVRSATTAFDLTSMYASLPRLLPEREVMSGIGLTNLTANVAQVAGPLGAGVLVVVAGTAGVLLADAALAIAATALALRVPAMPSAAVGGSALRSLREGLAYAAADPVIRWAIVLATAVGLFGRSVAFVMPAVATTVLHVGAVELSWLMAARGVGAFAGSVVAASLGALERRGLALALASLAFGIAVLAFSLQTALVPALVLAAGMGAAQFVFSGLSVAVMQVDVPDRLRGRMVSFYATTVSGVTPLGTFILGSAGAVAGIGAVDVVSAAALTVVSAVALVAAGPLRRYRVSAGATPAV